MPNSIDTPRKPKTKPINLRDVEVIAGMFCWRTCQHCDNSNIETHRKSTTLSWCWNTVCHNCNAHYGYISEQNTNIEQQLLADGWTAGQLRTLIATADEMGGGPHSLERVFDEINYQGRTIAS